MEASLQAWSSQSTYLFMSTSFPQFLFVPENETLAAQSPRAAKYAALRNQPARENRGLLLKTVCL